MLDITRDKKINNYKIRNDFLRDNSGGLILSLDKINFASAVVFGLRSYIDENSGYGRLCKFCLSTT